MSLTDLIKNLFLKDLTSSQIKVLDGIAYKVDNYHKYNPNSVNPHYDRLVSELSKLEDLKYNVNKYKSILKMYNPGTSSTKATYSK
jgi:hypothetical protein